MIETIEQLANELLQAPNRTLFVGSHNGVAILKDNNALYRCDGVSHRWFNIYVDHQKVCGIQWKNIGRSSSKYPELKVFEQTINIVWVDQLDKVDHKNYTYSTIDSPLSNATEKGLFARLMRTLPRHAGDYPQA